MFCKRCITKIDENYDRYFEIDINDSNQVYCCFDCVLKDLREVYKSLNSGDVFTFDGFMVNVKE